ncbi:SSU ribosomal protein S30P [Desulfomicrobium apsheronum]|jgi:putative sigma-54 modulation protein|uniref:Ribosome hibernation promoting factor n=1 Tax=Desulfomicrobium apsheronum TaxID=52560 RepID=A0A1I3TWD4_9BACT|nr:ribosome-associated translation inhibitor RaiA [Desulfomicrobium apsheronum]MDY0226102.1 ribosome-associated translation inhibitor RaiA [Desulfomicrobium apsheronum]SFJ73976.1 SSU ribosomal protein S30P [Desulfomicrobium apsheronum]
MRITFNFKNFDPSDHLRKYAKDRFGKLAKFMAGTPDAELQVNLEVEKFRHVADIVLTGKNVHISAREDSEDMYSTVDLVWDKLEAQMRKTRDKDKSRRKGGSDSPRMDAASFDDDADTRRKPVIQKTDDFSPKPMIVEEAALQLESSDNEFLVFLNAESERINVIYRRKTGDFGLIDPGV